MAREHLAGTSVLTGFFLRRDRVKLPVWVGSLGVFVLYIGSALPQIAPERQDLEGMVTLFSQPVGRMFTGPAFGMDDPSYERFFATGYAPYLFLLAALMNILLITRHTRGEEQTGRAELVRANVVGRHAPLTAALLVALITNALVFVVVSAVAIGVGFAPAGSVLVAAGAALTGIAFAGITATTAQLTEFSRTAAGLAGIVLGISFALRAVGDMAALGGSAFSWVSPLGWPAQVAPYVYNRSAPLLLLLTMAGGTIVAAFALQGRRDHGASLIAPRPGRAGAGAFLGTPFGASLRIQRGLLLGWAAGILAFGAIDGAFMQALVDAGDDMPEAIQEVLGSGALVDSYLAFLGIFTSVLVCAYAISALQTVRGEELAGRADLVLATPVSRGRWFGSHLLVIALGAAAVTTLTGLGTGIAAGWSTGDWGLVATTASAHLALLPAVLVVLSIGGALYSWAPRFLAPVSWLLVGFIAVVAIFGSLLNLPGWLVDISPFEHLAAVPEQTFAAAPFGLLLVLAAIGACAALLGIRRREINVV